MTRRTLDKRRDPDPTEVPPPGYLWEWVQIPVFM